jgi:hypothetical protein
MAGISGFFITEDTLSLALDDAVEGKLMAEVQSHALEMAQEILDYAQANAPWEDRTGDARRLLDVDVSEDAGTIIIQLYHQVDYGLWLEVIQNGRFAIIMPTLERFSGRVIDISGSGGEEG